MNKKIEIIAREANTTLEQASSTIKDVLRYTVILPKEDFYKKYFYIIDELENLAVIQKVKNTWYRNSVYKGINVNLKIDTLIFEIQFHTKESFKLKQSMHILYEEFRNPHTPRNRKEELYNTMKNLSKTLEHPENIGKIK